MTSVSSVVETETETPNNRGHREHRESDTVEVATFRSDIGYSDGRHPDEVRFSNDPREDVQRRDFTINGLLFDPLSEEVLDYVGGQADLRARRDRRPAAEGLNVGGDRVDLLRGEGHRPARHLGRGLLARHPARADLEVDGGGAHADQARRESRHPLGGITLAETNAARVSEQLIAVGARPITSFHHEAIKLAERWSARLLGPGTPHA